MNFLEGNNYYHDKVVYPQNRYAVYRSAQDLGEAQGPDEWFQDVHGGQNHLESRNNQPEIDESNFPQSFNL